MYKNQKGQFILELALVIPLLILIFMGIWQFGRVVLIKQREVMAVRYGAWLKAHTNMSHRDIESAMKKFLLQEWGERICVELDRKPLEGGFLDISSSLDGLLNKFTGVYEVSMKYKLKTIEIEENCAMTRNSWAGMGDTIKEIFKVEQ